MRLTVYNGSPRYKKSSTKVLLDEFTEGFLETEGNAVETHYLVKTKDAEEFVEAFRDAEYVLIAFPLYHDSMPSVVKTFIEGLAPLRGRTDNPAMLVSIHSGFAESKQCHYVERYMGKLANRLGCRYVGAILPGSVHRIETMPELMTRGTRQGYRDLGRGFGQTGKLDEVIVAKLAKPVQFKGPMLWLMRIMYGTGLGNKGWDNLAKRDGGYEDRLATPYVEE